MVCKINIISTSRIPIFTHNNIPFLQFVVYSSFLDDIKKPAKLFHLLAEQKTDNREIVVMNPKILTKIDGWARRKMVSKSLVPLMFDYFLFLSQQPTAGSEANHNVFP